MSHKSIRTSQQQDIKLCTAVTLNGTKLMCCVMKYVALISFFFQISLRQKVSSPERVKFSYFTISRCFKSFGECAVSFDFILRSKLAVVLKVKNNIVAAFRGMHVSPVKHSYAWLPRKCDYRTDRHTHRQTLDKVIPMCRYALQANKNKEHLLKGVVWWHSSSVLRSTIVLYFVRSTANLLSVVFQKENDMF